MEKEDVTSIHPNSWSGNPFLHLCTCLETKTPELHQKKEHSLKGRCCVMPGAPAVPFCPANSFHVSSCAQLDLEGEGGKCKGTRISLWEKGGGKMVTLELGGICI